MQDIYKKIWDEFRVIEKGVNRSNIEYEESEEIKIPFRVSEITKMLLVPTLVIAIEINSTMQPILIAKSIVINNTINKDTPVSHIGVSKALEVIEDIKTKENILKAAEIDTNRDNDYGRFVKEVAEELKPFEGYSEDVYVDTTGHRTIGWGHNIEGDNRFNSNSIINKNQAQMLLIEDVKGAVKDSKVLFKRFNKYSRSVKKGLVHLMFNMGLRTMRGFYNTVPLIKQYKYKQVRNNLRRSLWYKQVHATRGEYVINFFRSS